MAQNHYGSVSLSWGNESKAAWSLNPSGKLIVFVHGFAGGALSTWMRFPTLVGNSRAMQAADIVFYGYPSMQKRALFNATRLYDMLESAIETPRNFVNLNLPSGAPKRPAGFQFTDVVIVAHSLGAVIARRAMVIAVNNGKAWVDRLRLVLFAPAHLGADVARLASEALVGLPGVIPFGRYVFQSLIDLEPGSQTLTQLADDVNRLLPQAPTLRALRVYHGARDRVVSPNRFGNDPEAEFFDKNHIQVCKPIGGYLNPLTELEALL